MESHKCLAEGVEFLVGTTTQFITNLKSDGTFLESVAGDTQELFCDDTSRCTDDGTWHVMGTRFFICDPGCDDENFQYTISGNTLTVVVVDDDPVTTIVFVRLPEVIGSSNFSPATSAVITPPLPSRRSRMPTWTRRPGRRSRSARWTISPAAGYLG